MFCPGGLSGGFWQGGFCPGGFVRGVMSEGFCLGVSCPDNWETIFRDIQVHMVNELFCLTKWNQNQYQRTDSCRFSHIQLALILFLPEQCAIYQAKVIAGAKQLTLFDMRGIIAPQNVFDHCVETLRKRKLKLGNF